jgi:hypothetical protein
MRTGFDPLSFLIVSLSGWMNQHQQHPCPRARGFPRKQAGDVSSACHRILRGAAQPRIQVEDQTIALGRELRSEEASAILNGTATR